jgi:hypothetical protein
MAVELEVVSTATSYTSGTKKKRSSSARSAFRRTTRARYRQGRGAFWVSRIVPLACGGADDSSNMQWLTPRRTFGREIWMRALTAALLALGLPRAVTRTAARLRRREGVRRLVHQQQLHMSRRSGCACTLATTFRSTAEPAIAGARRSARALDQLVHQAARPSWFPASSSNAASSRATIYRVGGRQSVIGNRWRRGTLVNCSRSETKQPRSRRRRGLRPRELRK